MPPIPPQRWSIRCTVPPGPTAMDDPISFDSVVVSSGEDRSISIALSSVDDATRQLVIRGSIHAANSLALAIAMEVAAMEPMAVLFSPLGRYFLRICLRLLRERGTASQSAEPMSTKSGEVS